ncbi:MAG: alpha/beta hydrolase [Phycisphaerales bacterium]|nr:alpha/beta hydrolase [Hyphomonadaceae bacterium]
MFRLSILKVVLLALGLAACAPFSRDIPFATLETRYANAASQYLDLPDGVRVHYRVEGSDAAPALLMVHGLGASLHTWEPWVSHLRGRYRIITLDLPGHGLTRTPSNYRFSATSNAQLVEHVRQRVGAPHIVVAGHSMGGAVAVRYALAHPERVSALVLINATAWPQERRWSGAPFVFQLLANPIGRAVLRNVNPELFAERGLRSAYYDSGLVDDELVDRYVELARAPGHRAVLTSGQNNRADQPLQVSDFSRLAMPTLVVHGAEDTIISVQDSRSLAAAIPNAQLIVYPNVGHVPMEENVHDSVSELSAFLEAADLE